MTQQEQNIKASIAAAAGLFVSLSKSVGAEIATEVTKHFLLLCASEINKKEGKK